MNFLNSLSSFGKIFFAKTVLRITQLGADIDGEADNDRSGYSVSMNAAGNRVAIGGPYNDGTSGTDSGHVRIYEWNGTIWTQLGADIDGEAANNLSGYSVSINAAGDRVAIGAIWNTSASGIETAGHVRVYQWNGTIWTQLGVDIDGESYGARSGYSVSINAAGDRVAIGAIWADGPAGSDTGHVRVYQWNGTSWTQMGSDIDGEVAGDQFGFSVSMNAAGDRVVAGSYRNDGAAGFDSGHFRVYSWNGTEWIQMGADVEGKTSHEKFGYSVSMNAAGDRVVAGATDYSDAFYVNRGSVRIYQWNGTIWTQLGEDILGQPNWNSGNDFSGSSVSINSAGNRVAIGAPYNDPVGSLSPNDNRGKVSIFEWNGATWTQLGIDIIGEAISDNSGFSISMNSAGNTIAISAPYNTQLVCRGHVRVYQLI